MPKIIFNIATVARRRIMFLEVLKMLARQTVPCDKINIALSAESIHPDLIRFLRNHFKEYQLLNRPALTCENKMFNLDQEDADSYPLTFDDDIIYPSNYAERLIRGIEHYEQKAVIGFHGIRFDSFPVTNYKAQKTMYQYFKTVDDDTDVHVIGTGCLGFHLGTLRGKGFRFADINKNLNCLDGSFGRWCRDNKVRTIVLGHKADWMQIFPDSQDMLSLWKRSYRERYKTKLSFLQQ